MPKLSSKNQVSNKKRVSNKPKNVSNKSKPLGKPSLSKRQPSRTKGFKKVLAVILAIALPLGGGIIISLLTMNTMEQFNSFNQPPFAPPAWLFPVAWTILYILMGIASFLIYNLPKSKDRKIALILYLVQLGFNFLWTIIFFNLGWLWPALAWLIAMWAIILALIIKAKKLSLAAFWLLIPYLLWSTFATVLNLAIAILN